jgi:hypothetical protein
MSVRLRRALFLFSFGESVSESWLLTKSKNTTTPGWGEAGGRA